MAKQSLFSACKRVFRDGISGTYTVGNNDIFLELYSQQDIDQNNEIGNSSEENIVVVAGDTITIPEGYTLTPVKPKKSLVVICNTFVNNGTVSMYQKAPNVLPHDLFIIEKNEFGGNKDVLIPAYANNNSSSSNKNGINRQCGGGGQGNVNDRSRLGNLGIYNNNYNISGSGYAFGGGAGSGGVVAYDQYTDRYILPALTKAQVDSTYPMRSGTVQYAYQEHYSMGTSGAGNPYNGNISQRTGGTFINAFGCGGRIIIFCNNITNNGNINVNGTSQKSTGIDAWGGASGAGAIDVFYTIINQNGQITANGGTGPFEYTKGGNGSITLTPWIKTSVLKPIAKYMSKENMVYFLTNYIQRLKQGED